MQTLKLRKVMQRVKNKRSIFVSNQEWLSLNQMAYNKQDSSISVSNLQLAIAGKVWRSSLVSFEHVQQQDDTTVSHFGRRTY
jgi:hypothetical protein